MIREIPGVSDISEALSQVRDIYLELHPQLGDEDLDIACMYYLENI